MKCSHASKQEAAMPREQTERLQGDTYPARCEEEEEQGPGHHPHAAGHPESRERVRAAG